MAYISNPNYETVSAACDQCGELNIFSRIDELFDDMPISGKFVSCTACGVQFWLTGDRVSSSYQFLMDDAQAHFGMKRYMPAIASIAQAWEIFFAICASSTFVYRPFFSASADERDIADLTELHRRVRLATEKFTWFPMRNLVINMLIQDRRPTTIGEAMTVIGQLHSFGNEPSLASQQGSPDARLLAQGLSDLTIGKLRNNVVHKHAYRPRRSEVEPCLEAEVCLLYRVKHHLGVGDFFEHQAGLLYEARDFGPRE